MEPDPKPFPPGPFVVDKSLPGRVYCDDVVGTCIASCIFDPDYRMIRYDEVRVAARIADCLTACTPIQGSPTEALAEAQKLLRAVTEDVDGSRTRGELVAMVQKALDLLQGPA